MGKHPLGMDVLQAARLRISWALANFPRIYVSFSGGKDSTVMLHLVMEEAIRTQRKVGILFVDLEGQYKMTIDHIRECYKLYQDYIEPYWIALPLNLRNAVSQFEPQWMCWDPDRKNDWVRPLPPESISDESFFPFFWRRMEFEEFVPAFGKWYSKGQPCACFVGIRSDESLNRYRTIAGHGTKIEGRNWTNWVGDTLYNIYPIFDWATEDDWTYLGKEHKIYNHLYDLMYKAGLSIHQQRICQPYGDDQRKGLWLFHLIEPETWAKVVTRVNGANQGAIYAQETGDILGRIKITKPAGHTWKSFAYLLLESMPPSTSEHYKDKIAVFIHWWQLKGYGGSYGQDIPDEVDPALEAAHDAPSWRRVCKALLRNDYWCKGLSFSQHKSPAYEKYVKVMKKRRMSWKII